MTRDQELEKAAEEYVLKIGVDALKGAMPIKQVGEQRKDSFKAGAKWEQARSQKLVEALEFCWEHSFNATQTAWDDRRDVVKRLNQEIKIKATEALTQYKGGGE